MKYFRPLFVFFLLTLAHSVYAIVPTFDLSAPKTGKPLYITVHGDPDSTVMLYYTNPAIVKAELGSTDGKGNFATDLSGTSYNLACGNTAFVVVNGSQSKTINWNFADANCATLDVSTQNLSLLSGQTATVNVYGNTGFYLSYNSNADVANITINKSVVTVNALAKGTTDLSLCSNDGSRLCKVVTVDVDKGVSTTTSPYIGVAAPAPIVVTPNKSGSNEGVFYRTLKKGVEGSDVTKLQKYLAKIGVYKGPITGYFGALTEAAVKKYQKINGLEQVGLVGPQTRKILNSHN